MDTFKSNVIKKSYIIAFLKDNRLRSTHIKTPEIKRFSAVKAARRVPS